MKFSISLPTFPVAPTTATLYAILFIPLRFQRPEGVPLAGAHTYSKGRR